MTADLLSMTSFNPFSAEGQSALQTIAYRRLKGNAGFNAAKNMLGQSNVKSLTNAGSHLNKGQPLELGRPIRFSLVLAYRIPCG